VIPLFVRAGSIVPMGADIQSTATPQALKEVRVYPGKNAEFTLYDDDGVTYAYEKGGRVTRLKWDEKARQLSGASRDLVKVVGSPQ
jgi:alpha-D-xyloside xylohydrolase